MNIRFRPRIYRRQLSGQCCCRSNCVLAFIRVSPSIVLVRLIVAICGPLLLLAAASSICVVAAVGVGRLVSISVQLVARLRLVFAEAVGNGL